MDSASTYSPYFYIIQHSDGRFYAGSRTAGDARPDELLVSYFTSSNIVRKYLADGQEFVVVRTKIFETKQKALAFEQRFLRLFGCAKNDKWINAHDGQNITPFGSNTYNELLRAKYGDITNISQLEENKAKVSESLKGGINCWDEELRERRRVTLDEYRYNPDRFWHVQSKKYRNKYKNGTSLEKPGVCVPYNVYNERGEVVYKNITKFEQFCKEHKMPLFVFQQSANNGGTPVYLRKRPVLDDHLKFRGWYATKGSPGRGFLDG